MNVQCILTGTQLIYWLINADTLCIFKSFLCFIYLFIHLFSFVAFLFAHRVLGEESMNTSQEHGDHSADAQQRNRRSQVTARAHSWEKKKTLII